jgi:hypothetical protein
MNRETEGAVIMEASLPLERNQLIVWASRKQPPVCLHTELPTMAA